MWHMVSKETNDLATSDGKEKGKFNTWGFKFRRTISVVGYPLIKEMLDWAESRKEKEISKKDFMAAILEKTRRGCTRP